MLYLFDINKFSDDSCLLYQTDKPPDVFVIVVVFIPMLLVKCCFGGDEMAVTKLQESNQA